MQVVALEPGRRLRPIFRTAVDHLEWARVLDFPTSVDLLSRLEEVTYEICRKRFRAWRLVTLSNASSLNAFFIEPTEVETVRLDFGPYGAYTFCREALGLWLTAEAIVRCASRHELALLPQGLRYKPLKYVLDRHAARREIGEATFARYGRGVLPQVTLTSG